MIKIFLLGSHKWGVALCCIGTLRQQSVDNCDGQNTFYSDLHLRRGGRVSCQLCRKSHVSFLESGVWLVSTWLAGSPTEGLVRSCNWQQLGIYFPYKGNNDETRMGMITYNLLYLTIRNNAVCPSSNPYSITI